MTPLARHIDIVQTLRANYARQNAKTYDDADARPINITRDGYGIGSIRARMLEILRTERRVMSSMELAELLGKSRRNINDSACKMVLQGYICRPRRGCFLAL